MFDFLNKKTENKSSKDETYIEIACLLIHASKIDEDYTDKEKEIINKTLINLGADQNKINDIIIKATELEKNPNQILDFTKKVKNVEHETKVLITEALWKIIYSDKETNMFESNLMRRLTGLLYLSPKDVGDIKEKIAKEHLK